ncbi:hypothetical protein PCC8801_1747 [Rippkaea orientalis PCC 8801]|uniref:Uncharacterized protein n=1 Tax=Rippkaea orientalis (strain PCC 8801 / RF-1) TaxID=41431 RepID=B7JWU5_RIPO1|nr:hypothetical protein [Rippkaea orientalis]ACK65794.1 hypothetical protein PCC8801_1747 [Rippkaea orientalis PCC 8801]
MDPLTLAGIGTIVLTGALARVGEMALDGTIAQFKRLIEAKYPDIFRKLEAATSNPDTLPETIDVMATLIDNDAEIKAIAEHLAKENQNHPQVIQYNNTKNLKNTGFVAESGSNVSQVTVNQTFN